MKLSNELEKTIKDLMKSLNISEDCKQTIEIYIYGTYELGKKNARKEIINFIEK